MLARLRNRSGQIETAAADLDPAELAAPFPVPAHLRSIASARRSCDPLLRAADLFFAGAVLVVLAPLLLTMAIAIRASSPGPVLFRQLRYGKFGAPFTIFKFRTMAHGAAGNVQTSRNDPRVTGIGAFLRRTSLDELPQLLNIIRGDMSLCGPRPMPLALDHTLSRQDEDYALRFLVRPGLTGLAQVNGFRGAVETPHDLVMRVRFDNYYVRRRTLTLYFTILISTAFVFLAQENAR